jgi:hypothetical protein
MLAHLEVKEINSKTFKDYYRFSRTFQSWTNFFSPIQGLPRLFNACGHPDFVCIKFKLKDAVHSVLRISSAHNKGGPPDINIAQILHLLNFFELKHTVYIHLQV